jgi:hypothetical protein
MITDQNGSRIYQEQLDEHTFRLLEIDVCEAPDDLNRISCRLETYPLTDCPPYSALSYAWGEPLASRDPCDTTILLNGRRLTIQANLVHALRHYVGGVEAGIAWGRHRFWIDALCINQDDIEERNVQVSIMHVIYRNAYRVLIWLGPDPDAEAYEVREFLRTILKQFWIEGGRPNFEPHFLRGRPVAPALARVGLPPHSAEIWKLVVRFWDRTWFSRAWIRQEVVLAQYAEIWCGTIMFTFRELAGASVFFTFSGLGLVLTALKYPYGYTAEGRMIGTQSASMNVLQMMAAGRIDLESAEFGKYANRLTGLARVDAEGRVVYTMLRVFAGQLFLSTMTDASDPRDRVFSMLGMMKHIASIYSLKELPFEADYRKSAVQVQQELTAWIINESGWLGYLSLVHQRRALRDCRMSLMPSWVVDLSFARPVGVSVMQFLDENTTQLQKTSRLLNPLNRPQANGSVLQVSVKRIGTVTDVGDDFNAMVDDGCFEETAKLLLKCPAELNSQRRTRLDWWMDTFAGRQSTPGSPPCSEESRELFTHFLTFPICRRILRDSQAGVIAHASEFFATQLSVLILAEQDESHTVPDYAFWKATLPFPEKNEALLGGLETGFGQNMQIEGRRLLRLGRLGFPHCPAAMLLAVGPKATEIGDEVCLVAGSLMPFIVRRVGESDRLAHELLPQYYFVGEAHVNGCGDVQDLFDGEDWERWLIL